MPKLSKRVDTFTDSVIRRMTRISDAREGSINLSQGFPDFDPPQVLLDALAKMASGWRAATVFHHLWFREPAQVHRGEVFAPLWL